MNVQALTAYNVPILSKSFAGRADALAWAETEGRFTFPGLKVVQLNSLGRKRTLWEDKLERVAA